MSKKMWSKIFKSSKTSKVAKLTTTTAATKQNKRCSIYEEYQQLNGQQADGTKKQKKLSKSAEQTPINKQQQEEVAQLTQQEKLQQHTDVASGTNASMQCLETTATTTTTTTAAAQANHVNKNSEVMQKAVNSDDTLAACSNNNSNTPAAAGANDQLIANKTNCGGMTSKQQSTFAKVVSSFTLKRSSSNNNNNNNAGAQKQQHTTTKATQKQKGNGNVNAAGKLPKSEFIYEHATPTNNQQPQQQQPQQQQQQQQQQQWQSSSHALQQQQLKHDKGVDVQKIEIKEKVVSAAATAANTKEQQQAKRSSQVLIVIKQIVTIAPKILPPTTTTTAQASSAIAAATVTDSAAASASASVVLDKDRKGIAADRMHSSATHDNVCILAASTATNATTKLASASQTVLNTTTTTTTTTTSTNTKAAFTTINTNTRMSTVAAYFAKNTSSTIANTTDPYPDAPTQLVPCPICHRTFNPVTLQKHVGICEKMATKKRNVFDSSRQRREGTELASYPLPKNFGLPPTKQEPRGQSPKPLQHIASPILARKKSSGGDELVRSTARASMRKLATNAQSQSPSVAPTNAVGATINQQPTANSQMTTSTASTTSLPGASNFSRDRMRSSDRSLAKRIQPPPAEQCPHCERCFGVKAYDRHVEWCKEKALQASIKQTSKTEQNLAKERLEARTKYRAPCLKTKRSINRDKYAGLAGDENEFGESVKRDTAYSHNNSSSVNNSSSINNNNSSNNNNNSLPNGIGSKENSNNINNSGNTNTNGLMSLSMTSSITSERKSTMMKDFQGTLRLRKAHRNAIELPPPSPTRLANVATDDYVKSACFDNFRLMGSKLVTNEANKFKTPKRRITLSAIGAQAQQSQQQQQLRTASEVSSTQAPPQSPQFEKIHARGKYDEAATAACAEQTREQCLGDVNALSATLTYTACPLKGVNKTATQPRNATPVTHNVVKRRTKLKPKVPSEPNIRVDVGTVMTDHDEGQCTEVRNSQSYELVQKQSQQTQERESNNGQQQLQRYTPPLTAPLQMLQTRQSTFDKLPNTTIAMTTVETATTSSAAVAHTKLEVNAIRSLTICRPKRKKLVRQSISSHALPMKAIPLLKESIEIFGAPTKLMHNDDELQLKDSDSRTLADDETDDEIKVIKAPPKLARDKSFVLSGLPSDKYDPFLSAKRQLEELCSSSPPTNPSFSTILPKSSPQTPTAQTGLPTKMTTSLTLSTSTPNSSPLTTNSQNQRVTATPSMTNTKNASNFRRTSSLRGPRRSPMLSSRPLFAQNHRPTIQRGLSDEGPISTNFLKPEEYDEMPVRSVCVNDYAVTKSPRVTRRDNSLSNRKQSLKLNALGSNATTTATNTPNSAAMMGVNSSDELMNSAAKYLSKTDSLAAFLKYEKELEKPNTQAAADANANASLSKPNEQNAVENTSATNLHNPIITKELKEKSNTLSKQNSAKSIKAEHNETSQPTAECKEQERSLQHLPTPIPKTPLSAAGKSPYERGDAYSQKTQPLRLESISLPQATSTPLVKQTTNRPFTQTTPTQLPAVDRPLNLNALLGDSRQPPTSTLSNYSKEVKSSSSNEYIDPKLINKCDNLPVSLTTVRSLKSLGGGNNGERQLDFSSSSSECSAVQSGPISQLTKLLPLSKPSETLQASTAPPAVAASPAMEIPSRPSTTDDTQSHAHPTLSQRSSAEGRNLLNRKKRLGRNHFLYDASPEADDSCSADDEANRSSVEYYESKYRSTYQQQQLQQQQQQQQLAQQQQAEQQQRAPAAAPLKTPPIVPPLPIFDDFDFEEFLSSFENDDEQFPLFKDCREFLLNRTSNKQRSTQTPNSINLNNNNSNNNNNNSYTNTHNHTTQTKDYNNSTPHFQFPTLASNNYSQPTLLLTPSSRRSRDESRPKSKESSPIPDRYEELKRVNKTQNGAYGGDVALNTRRHTEAEHKKREIFISIETEPNEHGRSPISPDSLRSMVGNPQTMVEVEVDGCDNKFSKISDDDEQLPPRHGGNSSHIGAGVGGGDMLLHCTPFTSGNHLPNVQLNNAKNLIQRMQDDFRQMSEEVGANIRQAMTGLSSAGNSGSMLYGTEPVSMPGCAGGRGGTYVPRHNNTSPTPTATTVVGAVAPMYAASGDVSGDACGDSDDMSSLDGYPISPKSSRRGVGSKLSADSAYGSLSRQRSSELSTTPHRSAVRNRPATSANTAQLPGLQQTDVMSQHAQQQDQKLYHYQHQQQQQQPTQLYKYASVNVRPRRVSASSSSENSDGSDCNVKYKQQQQQQQQQMYGSKSHNNNNNNNNNSYNSAHYAGHNNNSNNSSNNNNNNYESPLSSPTTIDRATRNAPPSGAATTTATLTADLGAAASSAVAAAVAPTTTTNKGHYSSSSSLSSTNAAMSASMKMSKFCHECGARFLVEQAKFCMDCGVKRIVL